MSDDNAAFTIDLTGGDGEETPGAKVGRVVGGLLLLILGVVIVLASAAAFIGGAFIPGLADWYDWISDGILFIGIIGCVLVVIGFELMRRSRKQRRAAEAAQAAAVMDKLKTAGVYDGTEDASGVQPARPPIAGPTIT